MVVEIIKRYNYDFFVICETWYNDDSKGADRLSDKLNSNGYELIFVNRKSKGGGIAICYKKKWEVKVDQICETMIWLRVRCGCDEIAVAGVYFPPSRDRQRDEEMIEKLMKKIQQYVNTQCLIIGDVNAPLVAWRIETLKTRL